jgi:ketosteroid isomerase-like protein
LDARAERVPDIRSKAAADLVSQVGLISSLYRQAPTNRSPLLQEVFMARKFDTFGDLLRGALGPTLTAADDFFDLFTEDVVFEFPYAPEGLPQRLDGRDRLAAHFARLGPLLEFDGFDLEASYVCGDTVVFEFTCEGRAVDTGVAYDQTYISVVTLRDGRIARYRDYWNPLVTLAALDGTGAAAALAGENAARA